MGLQLLSAEMVHGIEAKLERANENIQDLASKINVFLKERPTAAVGDDKEQAAEAFWQYHLNQRIPLSFSVIAGEIIHHFRSCLDHMVWDLSSGLYRQSKEGRDLGFPILKEEPLLKAKIEDTKEK